MQAKDRLIVALDFSSRAEAEGLADELGELAGFYKIGFQLFMRAGMDWIVQFAQNAGGAERQIFLDLKMDDIDRTIRTALEELPGAIKMITLRGGAPAVRAACQARSPARSLARSPARDESRCPLILGVPWLSSMDADDFRALYTPDDPQASLEDYLLRYAQSCLDAGCDGFIAAGEHVGILRDRLSAEAPLLVTPGVRIAGGSVDEHKRSLTPSEAIQRGADYLVVGRPIYTAANPRETVRQIIEEIAEVPAATPTPDGP